MKHIKTTAAITAALLLCLSGTAEAEYIDSARYNYSANKAEIDGRFFDNFNDSYATILVLKEGGNINKIHDSLVEKQDQVKIKDGKFSFSFPLSEPGSYTAYVEAGGKSRVTTFTCANDIDMINADLFTIGSEDAFSKVVDLYSKELNISESVYGKLKDKEKASKLAFAEKDNVTSVDEVRDLIKAYSYMEALNESQYSLLLDGYNIIDAEILGFDTLDEDYKVTAYNLYKTLINDAGKTKLFEMMQGQNFKTLDEMKKSFIYNATIAAVKYNKNSGTGHIKTVLENNNAVNGFDLKNYNSSSGNAIDLSLVNGSEWKKEDIQKLLNSKTGSKDDSRGDVGGNGSNRGGTTTGGGKPSGNYSQNYSVNQPDKNGFTDIDESTEWARESIEKLAQKGIVNGRDENSFAPKELVTRAEFLKMVISVFDLKADNAQEISFDDVTSDKWYYEIIKTANALNIAGGYGNGYFGAEDNITRQDASVIMARAAQAAGFEFTDKEDMIDFADREDISDYAAEATEKLVKAGILHGNDDGSFKPKDNCTRAQAAVMLANILGQLEAKEG